MLCHIVTLVILVHSVTVAVWTIPLANAVLQDEVVHTQTIQEPC